VLDFIFKARCSKTTGVCPKCKRPFAFYKKVPGKYAYKCECNKSKLVFPLKGTPLEHCKKPLNLIIEIIYEMFSSKHSFTATQIDRKFDVRKNETSHLLLNKISDWMGRAILNQEFREDSIIEVDEVYPYVQTGLGPYFKFKRGLGSERLQTVVTFVERDGITKAIAVDNTNSETIKNLFRKYTKSSHTIFSDESKIYNFLDNDSEFSEYNHFKCNHSQKKWVVEDCHTNTVESFNSYVKKYIHDVHLGVTSGKIQLYLNRVAFNYSFNDKTIFEAIDILFDALPGLHENIENRIKCNRTIHKWLKAA
jgi:transposase-like protein